MKKVFLCSLAAAMLLCSCSLNQVLTGKSSSTVTASTTTSTTNADGVNAGKALRSLYTNYKADGKYDTNNLNNIMSTISLINSCQNLKANMADKTYWSSFAQGLVTGSENLVTEKMSEQVTTQLSNIVSQVNTDKLNNAVQQASAVKSIASDVSNLLASFK